MGGQHQEERESLVQFYVQDSKPIVPGGVRYAHPFHTTTFLLLLLLHHHHHTNYSIGVCGSSLHCVVGGLLFLQCLGTNSIPSSNSLSFHHPAYCYFFSLVHEYFISLIFIISPLPSVIWPSQIEQMVGPELKEKYNGFVPAFGILPLPISLFSSTLISHSTLLSLYYSSYPSKQVRLCL